MRSFIETVVFTTLLVFAGVVSPVLTEWHPAVAGVWFAGLAASLAWAVLTVSRAQTRLAARRRVVRR